MNNKAIVMIHDPAMVESLSKALIRPDLSLHFANTVGGGLAALSRNHTAIVFCEARLPDGSFRQVMRFLESKGRKTPVVVCANFYDPATDAESATLGARAYITYPFFQKDVQRFADRAIRQLEDETQAARTKAAA